jgi:putative DNA primase/helicase
MSTLAALGIHLRRDRDGEHRLTCPHCPKGKSAALSVRVHGSQFTFRCYRCDWSGSNDAATAGAPQQEQPPHRKADKAPMLELWRNCRQIEPGTTAASYLGARCCALPHPEGDLRWHPALRHKCGSVGSVLAALMTDAVTGEPLTMHRTWIQADGTKAAVEPSRLYWPGLPNTGGVVRLWPDDAVTVGLLAGEGIETCLSAAAGFGLAWACLDAWHLKWLPILDGIEALTIVADNDLPDRHGRRAGPEAAEACSRRWLAAGKEVRIWTAPSAGTDFNDLAARRC